MTDILEPAAAPGLRHALVVPIRDLEWRQAENGRSEDYTLRGHAAVFNSLSDDLGGFREILAPGAFRAALRKQPDVRLLVNHDANRVLARTANGSLELREDTRGLHVWARVKPRAWVDDFRTEVQEGLLDQMSFAFTIREDGDDWQDHEDGRVVRTVLPDGVDELYDVSVVTYPAFPATDVAMRELRNAVASGRLPATVLGEPAEAEVPAANPPADNRIPQTLSGDANRQLVLARRKARLRVAETPTP